MIERPISRPLPPQMPNVKKSSLIGESVVIESTGKTYPAPILSRKNLVTAPVVIPVIPEKKWYQKFLCCY